MAVSPIPEGYHTLTPSAAVHGCDKAVEFYKRAFGAEEKTRFNGTDGKILHCELKIGDSIFMMGEAVGMPPHSLHAMLYVEDCDAVFEQALEAGATAQERPTDQFYGDRTGRVLDPFGNVWYIATHKEDVSEEEMRRRWKATLGSAEQAAE